MNFVNNFNIIYFLGQIILWFFKWDCLLYHDSLFLTLSFLQLYIHVSNVEIEQKSAEKKIPGETPMDPIKTSDHFVGASGDPN